ncbi:hypothetical protein FRC07_005243 [Ceratobasidium sp. 392]|nr:hypothetical protein FRC07_005243 [Ceratobasidium sp. 392]
MIQGIVTAIKTCIENKYWLAELEELGLKPWLPWWAGLPHLNFHASLTPDLLHQLHQGLFKTHLIPWAYHAMGEAPANWQFQAMSKAEGMRYFKRKISKIKRWTGRESKELMKQFLPVLVGSACDPDFIQLVRAALDFMYIAHSAELSEDDIAEMEGALETIHRLKAVVVKAKTFQKMERFDDIPKLHMLSHYADLTRRFGAPDGYNSKSPEHLHIIYAKTPYRASNKVQPTKQMVKFIERQDALRIHKAYLLHLFGPPDEEDDFDAHKPVEVEEDNVEAAEEDEYEDEYEEEEGEEGEGEEGEGEEEGVGGRGVQGRAGGMDGEGAEEGIEGQTHGENEENRVEDFTHYPAPVVAIANRPTKSQVPIGELTGSYGAGQLMSALQTYLTRQCHVPEAQVINLSPHHALPVWHKFSLHHTVLPFAPAESRKRDVVRAHPAQENRAEAFDTVLLKHAPTKAGLRRYRPARVRAIFGLPASFPELSSHRLVYLELFSPFAPSISPFHRMLTTGPQLRSNGQRHCILLDSPIHDPAPYSAPHQIAASRRTLRNQILQNDSPRHKLKFEA